MPPPPVALFGQVQDPQLLALRDAVAGEGGNPLPLDLKLDENGAPPVSLGAGRMSWGGVDFAGVQSLYIRGLAPNALPALPPVLNPTFACEWRTRYVRDQEYQAFTYSFFEALAAQGKLVVNPPVTYIHHNSKAQFYERLRGAGFALPRSLSTNDPARAREFMAQVGEAVVKPGIGVGSTRRLPASRLERLDELAACPATFQEYIQGQTLRVHVVGDKVVLALRILGESVDSRTHPTGFEYMVLPDVEAGKLARANRLLGLHFAAWDVIRAADGRCHYLDCNPGPFLMWIGKEFVAAVYRQLARYLVTFARTQSLAEACAKVEPYRKG
jgi:hypothetical protein